MHDPDATTNLPAVRDVDDDTTGPEDLRRRRAGSVMILVGILGLIVAVAGAAVGWRLVGDLRDATTESVDLTLETLDSVEDTVDLSEDVLDAIGTTVGTTESTLRAVDVSFDAGSDVISEVADLTSTVGPTLSDVASVLRQLEGVAGTVDDLLDDLSSIPFGPDYEPDQTLGDTVGTLASTVEELPGQFESASEDLADFDDSLLDISEQVAELTTAVGDVRTELDGTQRLVTQYRSNIADARAIAESTRDDLDTDVTLMRIVLVVGALTLILGQIVPFWLGRELLSTSRDVPTTDV